MRDVYGRCKHKRSNRCPECDAELQRGYMTPKNPSAFFTHIRTHLFRDERGRLGFMTQSQVNGVNDILNTWSPDTDPRIVAYALATAYWETDFTMQPVAEIGEGRGYRYGAVTGLKGQVYYGRGYVQMTWLENYKRADKELHADGTLPPAESLVDTPELALRPDIAAHVMVRGMLEGWFGPPIGQYFTAKLTAWDAARHNINGTDNAARIGTIAREFYSALIGA